MQTFTTAAEMRAASLGRLVAERQSRASFFASLGVDYCCGGQRSLEQACAEARLDVAQVLKQLNDFDVKESVATSSSSTPVLSSAGIQDIEQWPVAELVGHILHTHHEYLRKHLPILAQLAEKVARVHGPSHPYLKSLRADFDTMRHELEQHLWKEEQVLFPLLSQNADMPRNLDAQIEAKVQELAQEHANEAVDSNELLTVVRKIKNEYHSLSLVITDLKAEHITTGQQLAQLRSISQNFQVPAGGCGSYTRLMQGLLALEVDLHLHIHKENNVLFPKLLMPKRN